MFSAVASDADGAVGRVEFVMGDSYVLGAASNCPFALWYTFTDGAGPRQVRARATDDAGLATLSNPIEFDVEYPPPANDDFASRLPLEGTFIIVGGSLYNATRELEEPTPVPYYQGGSAWWSWTAPASGKVTITNSGTFWFLGAYAGTNLTSLVAVATNFSFGLSAQLAFDAVAGNEYQIACVSLARSLGRFQLALFLDARELRGPRRLPDGSAALDLRTTVERLWILEASTNLMDWAPIASGHPAASTMEFLDPTAASHPRRFYRAMAEP